MLKIYWFYKVLQNIKKNNITEVIFLIEKYFEKSNWDYFLHYSYSYSYDCFVYFYKKNENKKGKDYTLRYYHEIKIKKDCNLIELNRVFNYDFETDDDKYELYNQPYYRKNRLRYQIISSLIKKNKLDIVKTFIKDLDKKETNAIFNLYFDDIYTVQKNIKEIISIFSIEEEFFKEHVFTNYGISLNKSQYEFLKQNYAFEASLWKGYFAITENEHIIEDIVNNYDIKIKEITQKLCRSFGWAYEYGNIKDIIDTINLFKKLNLLTEENILQSYKEGFDMILIDYHFFPLFNFSEKAKKEILRNNLRLIVYHSHNYYKTFRKGSDSFSDVLDNYFNFIESYFKDEETTFIKEAIEYSVQISEEITIYFYDKFPELFMEKSYNVFNKLVGSSKHEDNFLLKKVIEEKNQNKKINLLESLMRNVISGFFYHQDNNKIYFFIKESLNNDLKEKFLKRKIQEKQALPVLIDIWKEEYFSKEEKINENFYQTIGPEVSNALYMIDNYELEKESLVKSFMNLSYHKFEEQHFELSNKILAKKIELSEFEIETLKDNNIEMYKLYHSYFLNHKLNDKLKPKEVKIKKTKI